MEAIKKPTPIWLYFACLALGTIAVIFFYPLTLEDAYITFHYSHAFAVGDGIGAWNVGQPPVEGFSSSLWMFLIGYGEKAGLSPFFVSKLAGYLSYALTSLLFLIASIRERKASALSEDFEQPLFLAAIISALYLPLLYYSMTGMEVTFVCAQVAATLLTPFLFRSNGSRALWSSLLALSLVFTRPEGIVIAVLINGYWLLTFRRKSRWPLIAITSAIAMLAAMTAYRMHHFGELVPNTDFAKATGGTLSHRLALGIRYVRHFFLAVMPFTIVFILGAYAASKRRFALTFHVFLLGFFALYALYILKVGGDPETAFPFSRQFAHIAPIWILYLTVSLALLVPNPRKALIYAVCLILLTDAEILIMRHALLITRQSKLLATYGPLHLAPENPFYAWLRQFAKPDALSSVSLAGEWPFYVPGSYIDNLGLNDAYIAKHGHLQLTSGIVDSKSDMSYVMDQRPQFIDGYISGQRIVDGKCPLENNDRSQMVDEMKTDAIFQKDYVFVKNAPYGELDRALFVRGDIAAKYPNKIVSVPVTETSLYRTDCPIK
jgi:arabinofuranosyltransferase